MTPFLRRALLLDAVATGATAAILIAGAGPLAAPLGLPAGLLRGAGLALVLFGALVGWIARRPAPSAGAVRAVIGLNAAWVFASIALLVGGWALPTALGTAFVIAQAVIVAGFAELQLIALRRAGAVSAGRRHTARIATTLEK